MASPETNHIERKRKDLASIPLTQPPTPSIKGRVSPLTQRQKSPFRKASKCEMLMKRKKPIVMVYNQTEIDISHLTKGMYLIKVKMDGTIKTKRIIKID